MARLLIAGRGEIARRIMRTAREMGIATVAVYAEPDADAPFVREADQAVSLRGTTSQETYLDIEKIIAAARRTEADAVHPGYGFLAENAGFARAVVDAGLTWVGPRAEAIATMGDKLAAKKLMTEANVPTLPSVRVARSVTKEVRKRAAKVGYPLLVKAASGGGGKGMRVVSDEAGLADAVSGARREAAAAFGDDTVFLERFLA
ncbi:MAG: acety-l/propionyl-CoA carboxylase subunit alpha, partial [Chloroflexi bacterium]|nr:acety-l/propionyl-CoA carboxylase subunit alpha [Chloroflexota bacterium]